MPTTPFARVKEVFEQWSMYDAVVQGDYMAHNEIVVTLAAWAKQQPAPFNLIDLDCGDAWLAVHAFHAADVASYHGVDVSESAAELARQHTAIWQGRAQVTAGNLADILSGLPTGSANVVLASYSLHHFQSEAKIALLADIDRVLSSGGTFLWIDAVRRDDESRDAYITRLTTVMQNDWTELTPDHRERGITHVRESDYPETGRWMLDHTRAAGFHRTVPVLHNDFFDGWAFTKSA